MPPATRTAPATPAIPPAPRARVRVAGIVCPLLALLLALSARTAFAAPPPLAPRPAAPVPVAPPPYPYPPPPPAWCWIEVRLFETLRYGPLDVCRKRLRYRPGALECYRIIDRVCATVQGDGQIVNGRTPTTREVVPCPRGVEPPVCRALDIE